VTKRKLFLVPLTLVWTLHTPVPAYADPAMGYEWSTSTFVVTPQLLGIATDGSKRAGVDQAAFIDGKGNLRLIFASYDEKKRSVISTDGGKSWSVDSEHLCHLVKKELQVQNLTMVKHGLEKVE
jgi:hypothetical protein